MTKNGSTATFLYQNASTFNFQSFRTGFNQIACCYLSKFLNFSFCPQPCFDHIAASDLIVKGFNLSKVLFSEKKTLGKSRKFHNIAIKKDFVQVLPGRTKCSGGPHAARGPQVGHRCFRLKWCLSIPNSAPTKSSSFTLCALVNLLFVN